MDVVEQLAIDRVKQLFGAEYANDPTAFWLTSQSSGLFLHPQAGDTDGHELGSWWTFDPR